MSHAPQIQLDRGSRRPLYEQLRDHFAREISAGTLPGGSRLPATRALCHALGVNRATVVEAYRRLESDGLIEQRLGSGTYVRATAARAPGEARARGPRHASRAVLEYERGAAGREALAASPDALDLASIAPVGSGDAAEELGACLASVFATRSEAALGYASASGDPRLREILAARLTRRGLVTQPSSLLIVSGAQQGLDLVFRALLDPGDAVLTESPTYHLALDLLRLHRVDVAAVPLLPGSSEGSSRLDAERLHAALARARPVLAYTMPTFQNPTGLTLDLASRRQLAAACAAAGVVIVEDDYEADMGHGPDLPPPIAALPEARDVVYVGTLSKALFPGLRVGWVVAGGELLSRIAHVKRVTDLSGSPLAQAAAAEFLATGAYDRHVAARVARDRSMMKALLAGLRNGLPEGCRVTSPQGGHAAWVGLPAGVAGRDVARRAAADGVLVAPGELFSPEGAAAFGFRVSIARLESRDVGRVVDVLSRAVGEVVDQGAPRRGRAELEMPVRT